MRKLVPTVDRLIDSCIQTEDQNKVHHYWWSFWWQGDVIALHAQPQPQGTVVVRLQSLTGRLQFSTELECPTRFTDLDRQVAERVQAFLQALTSQGETT